MPKLNNTAEQEYQYRFGTHCENSIIRGDCLQVLKEFRDESVDFILFSPPYDQIRTYDSTWQFNSVALGKELFRIMSDQGMCAVIIGDGTKNFAKSLTSFRLAVDWCDKVGWRLFECCIYKRDGNPGAWWSKRFRVDHEYIFFFLKGDRPKTFDKNHLMVPTKHAGKRYTGTDRMTNGSLKKIESKIVNPTKCRGTVWNYATSNTEGNKLKMKHPASYPDSLARDALLCFTQPGDLVLDPMCGSGTTCVIAAQEKRNYFGIDISEEYCEIAKQRIQNEVNTPQSTFAFSTPVS